MKKYISLFLILTFLLTLYGCSGNSSSKKVIINKQDYDEENTRMTADALDIITYGKSNYKIVISEKADDAQKDAANLLKEALSLTTGVTLEIVTDKTAPDEFEILVGKTNRDETASNTDGIAENEYRISVLNKKVCFNAGSTLMLFNGINDFLFKNLSFKSIWDYDTKEKKNCRLAENYSFTKTTENYIPKNPIYKKDEINAEALIGLFEGKQVITAETKDGMGSKFGMHFTEFIKIGKEFWCYYIQPLETGGSCVGLAITTDGVTFEKRANVLLPTEKAWDSRFSSFPGIWYDNGIFYLAYEGAGDSTSPGAVGLATSRDGINFKKEGIILKATGKGIYSVNVGTPDLFKKDGKWYLTYHTYDGKTCQMCVAIGKDLKNLTHHKLNPIIPTSKNGPDSGTTGKRDVLYYDGWFYMTYEISTKPPYATAKWSHTFARSKDFLKWETVDQLLPSNDGFGNDGPSFCIIDKEVWVYYRSGLTSRYKLALK